MAALKKYFIFSLLLMVVMFVAGCERRRGVSVRPTGALTPGDYDLTLTQAGLERSYKLHVPGSYDGASAVPLIIFLHGGGGSNIAIVKDGIVAASDKFGFILAAPNGTGPLPNKLLTWNAGTWEGGSCCGQAVKNNVDDVGFISALIDQVATRVNVDVKRVYATGISNGGMMSYRLACDLSDKLAAVAPVAPPAVPQDCTPARPISIMHIHGTADPCAPFAGGAGGGCLLNTETTFVAQSAQTMVDGWIKRDGISTSPTTAYQNGSATCLSYAQRSVEVEFCTLTGGGHAWPNGDQYLPVERVGPVSHDISFDQVWDFFSRHSLP